MGNAKRALIPGKQNITQAPNRPSSQNVHPKIQEYNPDKKIIESLQSHCTFLINISHAKKKSFHFAKSRI
ncbi:unnamed protein product [Diplocarpon coronariae]